MPVSSRRFLRSLILVGIALVAALLLLVPHGVDRWGERSETRGLENLANRNITQIRIPFHTAKLILQPSRDQRIQWDCRSDSVNKIKAQVAGGTLTLNLSDLGLAKCSISLPRGIASEFRGETGHMEVESPRDSMVIALTNGKVDIRPAANQNYDFDVRVKNGLQDFFPHSTHVNAVHVKVDVLNGLVKRNE